MKQLLTIALLVCLALPVHGVEMLYCDKVSYIAGMVMATRQAGLNKNNMLAATSHWSKSQRMLVDQMAAEAWAWNIAIQQRVKEERVARFSRQWLLKCTDWTATPVP